MEDVNKKIFIEYVSHLYSTDKSYEVIGKSIKAVKLFLESDYQVNRKGYKAYIRENAVELSDKPYIKDALCGFLNFLGIGYSRTRKEKSVKPLEKLSDVSEKNMKLMNEFVYYLTQDEDYSPHTIEIYSFSIKKYFEYANEVSVDNYKRFVRMLEDEGLSPRTIRLRITALERFSKWMKKPIELKRPKFKKELNTENVPTEAEYNRLLEYLKTCPNRDRYFFIKILATTGARVSEFFQFKWNDIISGEVTLKGKGNKYRRFFFSRQLQAEVKAYVKESHKTGYVAVGKCGRLTQRSLCQSMKDWGDKCGIDRSKMHPHAFRHFFAKMYLKKNNDVVQLADLLGHGSIDTTRIFYRNRMTNKKKNLIAQLRGSVAQLKDITTAVDGIDIYTETGHVDTDFLMDALICVNEFMTASNLVVNTISSLLAPNVVEEKEKKDDYGSKWCVEDILKHCTLEDNVLKLPLVQFNKKSYAEAKKWIEEAGGSWQGGKVQGFTFPFNADRVFSILHEGKRCNLQQEFQFFATPAEVADWLVMLAGGVHEDEKVLEPSAGTGAIIDAIHRSCPDVIVDCYELMPENKEILSKKDNIRILGDDFTKCDVAQYDKIIANPPFSKNQDIRHVRRMYECLNPGGVLAAITGPHWEFGSESECKDFRQWLEDNGGKKFEIEEGTFKESGTGTKTIAIVINK